MKSLSLNGPWAFYERKNAENECRLGELEAEVRRLKLNCDDLSSRLTEAHDGSRRLREVELPALQAEKQHALTALESVQAELARTRLDRAAEHAALTDQVSSLTCELQKLSAENAVLRSELAKTVHQKQVTNTKLEQIRKKLGLTESEAKAFIQELDEARASSKALREENTQLVNDNANLKQQLDSRSQHCMTLIGENKRLLGQVSELRMQLQKQQGDLWQAKAEQQAAAQAAQQATAPAARKAPQVVVREWQSGSGSGAAARAGLPGQGKAAGGAGEGGRSSGSQNQAPTSSSGGGAGAGAAKGVGARRTSTAGTAQHVPVGIIRPATSDAVKASVVRQALAVRQQRTSGAGVSVAAASEGLADGVE